MFLCVSCGCGRYLRTSFMFSSLKTLRFLVAHYYYWFNPWSLRAKVKDSENYLKRPTWAEQQRHASSIWIREEAKVLFRHAASLSVTQVCTASDRWASFSLDESCPTFSWRLKMFCCELSVIQICTGLDRWDLACTRLIWWDKSPITKFFGEDKFFWPKLCHQGVHCHAQMKFSHMTGFHFQKVL